MPISNNLKVLFDKHNLPTENADIYWSQVDDGWIPLIDKLITDLLAMGWDGDAHQIKEKFGGLRFYTGQTTPEQDVVIAFAERESQHTCERCGCAGQVHNPKAWLKTLCEPCYVKWQAR